MTRVKVCGITRLRGRAARGRARRVRDRVRLLAAQPGLLDPAVAAAEIVARAAAAGRAIGVFVDQPVGRLRRIARAGAS